MYLSGIPRSTSAGMSVHKVSLRDDDFKFTVPASWRSPTTNISVDDATLYARAVVDALTPELDPRTAQLQGSSNDESATLVNAMALLDYKAGTTNYHDIVTSNIKLIASQNYLLLSDGIAGLVEWALAAIRAHRAYNDDQILAIAVEFWAAINSYVVTESNANVGTHPSRNTTISQKCGGYTTAGAVFETAEMQNNTEVSTRTVGGFTALSAALFEITSDPKYQSAAELSATFLLRVMWLGYGTVIQNTIDISSCQFAGDLITSDTGKTLEAWSIMATKDEFWVPMVNKLVSNSIQYPTWTGSNGVITEGPNSTDLASNNVGTAFMKGFFIRGLYETWERTWDSTMAHFIQSYLTVQFNALRDLALEPGTNFYSPTWTGRAPSNISKIPGQLAALDALSSQISFARARDAAASANKTTPTQMNTPSSMSSPTTQTNSTKIIAGGICGGFGFVALILLGVWCIRRRHRRLSRLHFPGPLFHADQPSFLPQPFNLAHPIAQNPQKRLHSPSPDILGADGVREHELSQGHGGVLDSTPCNARHESAGGSPDPPRHRDAIAEVCSGQEGGNETSSTAPNVVELLHAIMARLPPADAREAPPSYYTGS